MTPKICLIAAVAENRVIGNANQLPWRIKSEFAYFVRTTKHKPIIMGRKTFETLDGPLKGRANIIVTRDPAYKRDGIIVTTSLDKALDIARQIAAETKAEEIMIGGGAEIYKATLPMADRLYLTEVHMNPAGDTLFPAFDTSQWIEIKREFHAATDGESADYTIRIFDRKKY